MFAWNRPGENTVINETTASTSDLDAQPGSGKTPPILTVDELAALLRVDRKLVYECIRRGDIPGVRKIGSKFRICRRTVVAWLAEGQGRVPRSRSNR